MGVIKEVSLYFWDYFEKEFGSDELLRAVREFIRPYDTAEPAPQLDEQELLEIAREGLFVEWLWFEYRPKGAKHSLIETFAQHTHGVPQSVMRQLEQLVSTQRYSFWRVGLVRPGNIELMDLVTGTNYHVREYSMADSAEENDCVFLRVARQEGYWEIVSGGGIVPVTMPNATDAQEFADSLRQPLSIKQSFSYASLLRGHTAVAQRPLAAASLQEARQGLSDVLNASGLSACIGVETVERLMREELSEKQLPEGGLPVATRLLLGLADGMTAQGDTDAAGQLLGAAGSLWNALTSKAKRPKGPRPRPGLIVQNVELRPWEARLTDAQMAVHAGKPAVSIEAWRDVFASMLDYRGTTRSLYRYYANAGAAYLADGDVFIGERLLDIALELCPDYDFALRQKDLLAEGHYEQAMFAKMRQRLTSGELSLPPTPSELQALTDDELLQRFVDIGLPGERGVLDKHISKAKDMDQLVEHTWGIARADRRGDTAHMLAVEANRRWTPLHPLPDTIGQIAGDIDSSLNPEFADERRSLRRAVALTKELYRSVQGASDSAIKSWMHSAGDYDTCRQSIVAAYLDIARNRPDDANVLLDLCAILYERTRDPMFHVPAVLKRADEGQLIPQDIILVAKQLPYDCLALATLAENLPAKLFAEREQALLLALEALDRQLAKKMYTYLPYDRTALKDNLTWVLDTICTLYEDSGHEEKAAPFHDRYMQVADDKTLDRVGDLTPEEFHERTNTLVDKLESGNPLIQYYEWFKTLDIDLSAGDGERTKLSAARINGDSGPPKKIGCNDPCPCGAVKPDGSPVKYKKCHGRP